MTDKGKGKVAAKTNHFAPPLDLPPAFGARGKLDPHSTVFTPLRPLDSSTVFGRLNHRDKVNESVSWPIGKLLTCLRLLTTPR
jgi:hypothetical protein